MPGALRHRPPCPRIRAVHVLSVIAVLAISAGILLAAQSGCGGATPAGADGSYDTPGAGPFEHAPVREVMAGGMMPDLTAACQIADSVWQVLDLDTFVPQPQYAFALTHPAGAFVTTWRTTAANQTVTIPVGNSTAIYDIDWGDGATETNATGDRVHTYLNAGTYTVSISGGFDRIYLHGYGDEAAENADRLRSIDQWGNASWSSMRDAFSGATNMGYLATDVPNLSRVTDATNMFRDAAFFDSDLSSWDVSSVTDMTSMFSGAVLFNRSLSSWDVSSVTDMTSMFFTAESFNGDLSSWNVSSVTDMSRMFRSAESFNGDLSSWDVSSVTDMSSMFPHAESFNGDLSSWNVSSVTDMSSMFFGADSFNQPLSSWNVSSVTDMIFMFSYTDSFNRPLSSWDVSSVTDMNRMFIDATAFNGDLSSWDVSSVTNMFRMFNGAADFNQPLSSWNVSSVTDMGRMFDGAADFNRPLSSWNVSSVAYMDYMFNGATAFNGDLSSWDVSSVTNMAGMFNIAADFNQPLNDWDVSSVLFMDSMFLNATAFNRPLSSWNVSSVTDMFSMFNGATDFNQPLSSWNVSSVGFMGSMFLNATAFDQDLANWYIVLNGTTLTFDPASTLTILPLSSYLDPPSQTYSVNDTRFAIDHRTLSLNPGDPPPAGEHPLAVAAPALLSEPNTASHTRIVTINVMAVPAPNLTTDSPPVTNAASVTVTVDFGKPIDPGTFMLNDISATGGMASNLVHSSANQNFTFTLTPGTDGEVTAEIPADRVMDIADNGNTASNVLRVTFDSAQPGPTLSTDADSPTNSAFTVTVDFGEPIDPATFTLADISVAGGAASSLAHPSGNQNFTFTMTPGTDGLVTAEIPADRVMDIADNGNTASNVLSVTFDSAAPSPTLSTDAASPTNSAFTVTVDFGEPIDPATFTLDDVSVTGGTTSNLVNSSANQNFTFTLTPGTDGLVTAEIPADRVMDIADNGNTASNVLRVTFDSAQPGPTLSTDADSPTNSAFTVTVDFGKPIDPGTFMLNDISATGGMASNLVHSSANQNFTFTLTPGTDGEVTAEIPADRVMDIADNGNTASNVLRVTFDSAQPGPTLSTDADSPTNAASVTVTVDFGEPIDPTTFTLNDVMVYDGTTSNLVHSSANQNFTFTLAPGTDGEVTASISVDSVTDPAGNSNTASNVLLVTFDSAAPSPTLSTDADSPTNSAFTVTVDFGKPIDPATFTLDDVMVPGGTTSNLVNSSANQNFTFTLTPSADGLVTASISVDSVTDPAGNSNTASNVLRVTFDSAQPGPTLSTDADSPTNSAFTVTVDFGKPIDPATFTLDDVSVTGGTTSNLVNSSGNQNFTFTLTPGADGQVTASIPADRVMDIADNGNTASNVLRVTFDSAQPGPTLSTDADSPTNSAFTVTVDFGEPIDPATFTLADISVAGGAASSLAHPSGNQNFTFTMTPGADGQVTASIPADRVTDIADNGNTASNVLSVTFDSAQPSPTLSTDAASPTNSAFTVTVDFGEPIDPATFTLADISVAGGAASSLAHPSGNQNFTFTLTPGADGQVTASIPADRVMDIADNGNTASNVLSVTFDSAQPSPTLSTDAASPTNSAFTVTVDFGEPIDPATFTLDDVSVTGGTTSNLVNSSGNQNFTFTLTPGADGQVTASISVDSVTDPAGNSNTASNVLRVTFDSAQPSPTLSTDADSPTNSAFTVTVDFGKPIDPATFTLDDVSVTGGTTSNLVNSSGNQNFTFTLTPGADGQVTASIPADRVMDIADNGNTASNVLRVTFDSAQPGPTLSTDAASPTNAASVTVTVDFGKPIDPATFTLDDVSVTGGTTSNLVNSSGNQNFTFTLTPGADGQVTASIPADRVMDIADNGNTASNVLRVTFDSAQPGPTLSTDAASPTNSAFTVTVDFGKPIDPATFTLGDVLVSGGTTSSLAHSSANQNFTFTLTPGADGQVTASIPADRVMDIADNGNTASNVLRVTFDSAQPGPTLSTDAASPTNSAFTVTVDFGKPIDPATFTLADISVAGGAASSLAHSSANQTFTFTLTPGADGQVTASIPADRVTDIADNSNTASNVLRVTFDSAQPGPTLSTDAASPTNSAFTVTVDFGEPIDPATFTLDDVSVTGGTTSNLVNSSGNQNFTFTLTPGADGQVTAEIPADRVMDIADNGNTASNVLRVTFDSAQPSPTLSTDADSPTNSAFTVTVDFGKPIDPATFTLDDVSVTGGTTSNLAHSSANQTFTFTLTPGADGQVTASIPADSVMDIADNGNTASNVLRVTFDSAQPGPTLSTDAASPTNAASVTVTVDFGKPIDPATFTLGDVSVTGGTTSNLAHSSANQTFTFTLTPGADGEVTAEIPADSVMDIADNSNTASNVLRVTFDSAQPGPTLSTDAASPTNAASVTVTVDFGKPIDPATFTLGDVLVSGGTTSNLAHSSANQTFTFTLTPGADGEVTAEIPADSVMDIADNSNTASNVLRVTFDSAQPGPTLSTDAASPTNAASVTVTVDFGKPIDPATFTLGDVLVSGGTTSNLAHSSANQTFTFTLTPGADGEVTAEIPADSVMDIADNSNTASNVLRVTFDSAQPGPTLSTDAASPTNAASVTVTVDFGKPIDPATFTLGDVLVSGGTTSNLAHSSANQTFTFTLTPGADGEVTAEIPADSVMDIADNSNTASNVLRVTFDSAQPGPTLSTDVASPTNAASVTVTVDFGKPIDPATFTLGDVLVSGGTTSNLAHSSANQTFTFTLTPGADGEVTAEIPADSVMDIADNSNTASNVLRVTFDSAQPGPTLSTDAASPTNAASVTVTVDFGKPIDPATFTLGDVLVSGGTTSNLAHSSANQTFTFTLTPGADGEVTAEIPADSVMDIADNSNTASNVLRVTFDSAQPGPTLSTDAASPTNAASVTVTVDFGKPIDPATFTLGDVLVSGGTTSNLAHSSANQTFTFTLTPGADGEVTAEIPADSVMDIADNSNTASNVLRVTFDRTAPVITVQGASPASIYAGQAYEDLGAACHDNLDGDLTGNVTAASNVDASAVGTYSVVYTCTDETGNTARETRTVSVVNQPLQTDTDRLIWTVEDLVGMLGSEGRHNFEMIARCDDGAVLTGATLKLHLGGLLTQIGANALETVDVPYKLVIDVERSWWDYPEYWSLASIITNTATAKIADTLIDYGITLDEYIDAGPDAVFEYPKYNATKEHLGGLDAYEVNIDWSGEGTCTVEWIRY